MRTITRRATTVVVAGMLTALGGTAAIAQTDSNVTQSVNPGSLAASLSDLELTAIEYSHTDATSAGNIALNVDDTSGTGGGWHVTVQSGEFTYDGDNGGETIPASNFALTSAADPVLVAGQEIDATDGPRAVTEAGSLDEARTVIEADVNSGQGEYTQDLGVELTVPGQSRAGTYTGTVTTTATSGPSIS